MSWLNLLKPTRWKLVLSLVPFILFLNQVFVEIDSRLSLFPIEVELILDYPIFFLGGIESVISQPFEPILRPLGWWSRDSIFIGPDGPLLPGSFAVAITYSLLIYVVWSLIGLWRRKKQQ